MYCIDKRSNAQRNNNLIPRLLFLWTNAPIYQEMKKRTEIHIAKTLTELGVLSITHCSNMKNYLNQRVNEPFCTYVR